MAEKALKGLLETFQEGMKNDLGELKTRLDEVQQSLATLQASVDKIKADEFYSVKITRRKTGFGMRILHNDGIVWVKSLLDGPARDAGVIEPRDVLVELGGTSVGVDGVYKDDDDVKQFLKAVGVEETVVFRFRRPSAVEAAKMRIVPPNRTKVPDASAGGVMGATSSVLYGVGAIGGALGGALLGVGSGSPTPAKQPAPAAKKQPSASLRHRPVPSTRSFIGTAYIPEDEKRVKAEQEKKRKEKENQDTISRAKELEVRQTQQKAEEIRRAQWAAFEQNKLKGQQTLADQDQQQEADFAGVAVADAPSDPADGLGLGGGGANVLDTSLSSNSLMDGADDSDDDELIDVEI
jgi:hypothetical protein